MYGFPGNTRFHRVIHYQNLNPEPETLRQFKDKVAEPDVDWSAIYYVKMQHTKPFVDFYTQGFIKCFPTLDIKKCPNYLGNLDRGDVGLGSNCIHVEE